MIIGKTPRFMTTQNWSDSSNTSSGEGPHQWTPEKWSFWSRFANVPGERRSRLLSEEKRQKIANATQKLGALYHSFVDAARNKVDWRGKWNAE
jgi:hypothetical protein